MAKKSAFPFTPGQRVNVPGHKNTQGLVSLPVGKADGECGAILTLAKPAKAPRGKFKRLPDAPAPDEGAEGRIVFVTWIADDGDRHRGYFTEACLATANPA